MNRLSRISRAIALGASLTALVTGCDKPPVPTGIPPVPPVPTEQTNPSVIKGTVCVGVNRGDGAGMIEKYLYRAAGLDPEKNPIPPTQPISVHKNPNGKGYSFRITYHTYGDLQEISGLQAPAADGSYASAVCLDQGKPKDPATVFTELADSAGLPMVPQVCTRAKSGDSPVAAMERALNKAGDPESLRYDTFRAPGLDGELGDSVLTGDVRAGGFRGTIFDEICVDNHFTLVRQGQHNAGN